ncbi:MAG: DUF4833 domain-containing protein [Bacteroidales bacterium]
MLTKPKILICLLFSGVSLGNSSSAMPDTLHNRGEEVLFIIERSRDADEIWYTTSKDAYGRLDPAMPVKVFWVRKSKENRKEQLTRIQNRFSYGIQPVSLDNFQGKGWKFKLAAYKDRIFELRSVGEGKYKVFTQSGQREIEVIKLYVEFDGGDFPVPSIAFVLLTGRDMKTGEEIGEIITGDIGR